MAKEIEPVFNFRTENHSHYLFSFFLLCNFDCGFLPSAYYVLSCGQCKAEFGKMYKTTPSHLDDLRNRFTFNVEKIDS